MRNGGREAVENSTLNIMRAGAAVLVVLTHTRALLFLSGDDFTLSPTTQVGYLLTSLGGEAVLIFFVLSGYFVGGSVIGSVRRQRFSWFAYFTSRLTRLWIVLLPALVLTLLTGLMVRHLEPNSYLLGSADYSFKAFLANLFFMQSTHAPLYGVNGALWSLTYEFYYYAMFPVLLVGVALGRGWVRVGFLAAAVAILVSADVEVWLLFAVWLMGAAVSWQEARCKRLLARTPRATVWLVRFVALGVLAAAILADRIMHTRAGSATPASFILGAATAVMVALLVNNPRLPRGQGVADWFGQWAHSSYSLYAIHTPLVVLITVLLGLGGSRADLWTPSPGRWLLMGAVVLFLIGCGWVFARCTEHYTDDVRRFVMRLRTQRVREAPRVLDQTR